MRAPARAALASTRSPPRRTLTGEHQNTGHELDPELDLVNMKGRIYDPYLGQFLQADPIISTPYSQGLNRYAYVDNSPTNFTDPTGLSKGWKADENDCLLGLDECRFSVLPTFGSNTPMGVVGDIGVWIGSGVSIAGGLGGLAGLGSIAAPSVPGPSGAVGGDPKGGGAASPAWQAAKRGLNTATTIHHGRKLLFPPKPPEVAGKPSTPPSGSRATRRQGPPTGVAPNAAAPGADAPACNPMWGCQPDLGGTQGPHGHAPVGNPIVGSDEFAGNPETAEFWDNVGEVGTDIATTVGGPGTGIVKGAAAIARAKKAAAALERAKNVAKGIPGKLLGPSGKPKIHNVDMGGKKAAREAAQRAGSGPPMHHPSPVKGGPHYHPTDKLGRKIPGSHYNYPK